MKRELSIVCTKCGRKIKLIPETCSCQVTPEEKVEETLTVSVGKYNELAEKYAKLEEQNRKLKFMKKAPAKPRTKKK